MGEIIHSKFSTGQTKKEVFYPGEKFIYYLNAEEARALSIIGSYENSNTDDIVSNALNTSRNRLYELSELNSLEDILKEICMFTWKCIFNNENNTEKYDIQFNSGPDVNFLNQITLLEGYDKEKTLSLFINYYIQSFVNWWNCKTDNIAYLDFTNKNEVRKRAMSINRPDIIQILHHKEIEGFSHRSIVIKDYENPLEVVHVNKS
ncbi:MAG: hypothetical protein KC550_00300 [Nanoarchaeota archaeon]|nr:hypothetical protein [Nanoarchaeota archaeon]